MTIDFTRDKIDLTADERGTIVIVAKGRQRKIARFTPKQVGQISRQGHEVLFLLLAKNFQKTK